jgi:hypothetical protein
MMIPLSLRVRRPPITQYAGGDKWPGRIAPNALRNLPPPFIRRNTLRLLRPTRAVPLRDLVPNIKGGQGPLVHWVPIIRDC